MALINKLNDLGDAVRERSGLTDKLTLEQMAKVVKDIPYPVVDEITITANGTYTPEEGIDGFSQVVVDTHIPVVEEITITENGTYTAPVGVDGYSPVVVDIPEVICPDPIIKAIEIVENGVYDIPDGVDGYGPITVDIPEVVCPEPVLESLTITENGKYSPATGIDGFNLVSVNVPSGGGGDLPDEAFNITGDCSYRFANGGWDWFIDAFGNQIATNDITNCTYMFYYNKLYTIPFDINCKSGRDIDMSYMFNYADIRQQPPRIINARPRSLSFLFGSCYRLREIPDDFCDTWDWSYLNRLTYGTCSNMFSQCSSLRKVSTNFLKNAYGASTSQYSSAY
jgi:hypothetical protein